MNTNPLNIAITINHTYVPYAYVMLVSFLENNPYPTTVYVIANDLSTEDNLLFEKLSSAYSVTFQYLTIPDTIIHMISQCTDSESNPESYYKLFVPVLIPSDITHVLYLDADIIVKGSLSNLYYSNFTEEKIALCRDWNGNYGTGVMLFHLSEFSQEAYISNLYQLLSSEDTSLPVSELFAKLYHESDILLLDSTEYNLSATYAFTQCNLHYADLNEHHKIIHYSGGKPWQGDHFHNELEQYWWDYAAKTPFYTGLLEQAMHDLVFGQQIPLYASNLKHEHSQLENVIEQYEILLKRVGIL